MSHAATHYVTPLIDSIALHGDSVPFFGNLEEKAGLACLVTLLLLLYFGEVITYYLLRLYL